MTATYRNEQHAAIRAVSVDAISTCKPSGWQQQHSSGFVEELTKRKEDAGADAPHCHAGIILRPGRQVRG